jgi:ABC-type iron transport system FetAB permease component
MYHMVHHGHHEETVMNLQTRIILFVLGLLIWILGSVYYAYRGSQVLETTQLNYWLSFWISPLLSATLVVVIFRLLHVAPSNWASAALLIAIPGMIGEAIVLSHLSTFMPRIQESSGGRYGAFLFATYAVVLGIAEFVTLKAT